MKKSIFKPAMFLALGLSMLTVTGVVMADTGLGDAINNLGTQAHTGVQAAQWVGGLFGGFMSVFGLLGLIKKGDPEAHKDGMKKLAVGAALLGLAWVVGTIQHTAGAPTGQAVGTVFSNN